MSIFNFSGFQSPPKRPLILPSPTSPFCTSPSQLQEVTLDQDVTFSHSLGARSPSGPMRGRSVKEIEEEYTRLKKENFNLKLRIYFLEERMGTKFNLDKDSVVKKNVELMVEVESLKKELEEKHELLCQAVKAMELEDEEHKKVAVEKDEILSEYRQEVESLKLQLLDAKADSLSHRSFHSVATDFSSQVFKLSEHGADLKELQEKIVSLEEELNQEKENTAAVQLVMDQRDNRIRNLSSQVEDIDHKLMLREEEVKDLARTLDESRAKHQSLLKKLQEKNQSLDRLTGENQQLRERYSAVREELAEERIHHEKAKMASDQKIMELQAKLEASLAELKKSQDLVVSKSEDGPPRNTDDDSFSVPKPTTPARSAQKDALVVSAHLPTPTSPLMSPSSPPASSPFLQSSSSSPPSSWLSNDLFRNMEVALKQGGDMSPIIDKLMLERDAMQQKIVKLKADQMKACKIIKSMIDSRNKTNNEIAALKQRNEELERELEGVVSRQNGLNNQDLLNVTSAQKLDDEDSMDEDSSELLKHYKVLTDQLEEKNQILLETLKEKDNHLQKVKDQYEEILRNIKKKEDHVVDLEFEILALSQEKNSRLSTDTDSTCSRDFCVRQRQDKDAEIEELNNKLLRRTCELQGLVNNELWDKNREIEKLQRRQASRILEQKEEEIVKLQQEVSARDSQLKLIKDKIANLGIEIDLQEGDDDKAMGDNQVSRLQLELEKSEKLRIEANEVCGILSRRLEELAVFLDSLLKQKSVLGFLGNKENKKLRQIIDQSLDLSRSFTMSMLVNPEQSLLQLTNISSLLNYSALDENQSGIDDSTTFSLIPINATLTYESHLYKKDDDTGDNAQIIEALRQQIVNLKYELQLRDVELSKLTCLEDKTTNTTFVDVKQAQTGDQSESEEWSEPDRSVSRARIGLLDDSLKSPVPVRKASVISTDSASQEIKISRTPSKRTMLLNESRQTIIELHKQVCDLDQKLNDTEVANAKLLNELTNIESRLSETESQLAEAEAKRSEIETILQQKTSDVAKTVTDFESRIDKITLEKDEAWSIAKEAKDELKAAEVKLRNIQGEYENCLVDKLKMVEAQYTKRLEDVQNIAINEVQTLQETIRQIRADCTTNHAKKREVEAANEVVERLTNQLSEAEKSITKISLENQVLKDQLAEARDNINNLKHDLDNATLQYSEAVLDKTQMVSQIELLEQELNGEIARHADLKRQVDQGQTEIDNLSRSHQRQISNLQQQRSRLEMRISELESMNAELHNRLVKTQNAGSKSDVMLSMSLPNAIPGFLGSYRRQLSGNSGYVSEDHHHCAPDRNFRLMQSATVPTVMDLERHESNSSPDLGIESDHGRFSSLETQANIPRPLLQTLELTESMSNLLDVENNQVQTLTCDNEHTCCQNTQEINNENTDLKRKLLRTRRALEETVNQLALANQRKKQVEKTICKQIHKTSQVLRKAKANLDSGSETDVYKK